MDITIAAIPHKNGCVNWTNQERAPLTPIDLDLTSVIEDLYNAVFQVFDHELDAIDITWSLDQRLTLLIFEHKVLLI